MKNSLFGLAERITGLRESVADKRAEVEKIKRGQRLFSIVGGQVTKIGHIFCFLKILNCCVVYGFISDSQKNVLLSNLSYGCARIGYVT